jgi:hypothetical protein
MAVMKQAIEHGAHCGHIAKQLAPVLDRAIGGQQGAAALIAAHDDLQQILGGGVHEQTTTGEAPFVKNSEFYGSTFEAAVDPLEQVDTSPRPPSRPKVYQMPKRDEAQAPKRSETQNAASR